MQFLRMTLEADGGTLCVRVGARPAAIDKKKKRPTTPLITFPNDETQQHFQNATWACACAAPTSLIRLLIKWQIPIVLDLRAQKREAGGVWMEEALKLHERHCFSL